MAQWLEVHGGEQFKLEHLGPDQQPLFQDLMDRVAAGLAMQGHNAWHDYLGPQGIDMLRARFVEGQVYAVLKDGLAVAGLTLQEHNHVWEIPKDKLGLWVHIIARDPDLGEKGIGNAMLGWAEGRARTKGRQYLRLESEETNPGLQVYLTTLGYQPIESKHHRGKDLILFEKKIAKVGKK